MLRGDFLPERNAYIAQEEPCIFHCHHYNTYLQAVIEDASSYLDVYPVLKDSAAEVAYHQFINFFNSNTELSIEDKLRSIEEYFSFVGFGQLDLSNVNGEGGLAKSMNDHYGVGWKLKFGQRNKELPGASLFTCGYIAGAVSAAFQEEGTFFKVEQKHCIAKGDEYSTFEVNVDTERTAFPESPQEGIFQTKELNNHPASNVDYLGIRKALTGMPLEGSPENGLINAFGVLLTRMYANYYCLVSYKFLNLFEEKMGEDGISIAKELLIEAGHVCAFNTFGGIMQSAEWNAMIKPMLSSKEDWVHGITAVVNALGWGFWEVEELIPGQKLIMKITSGYESNAYLKKYQDSSDPISFLVTGGVAGMMNLIYKTELTETPIDFDSKMYKKILDNEHFTAKQNKAREKGDAYDLIIAAI